MGLFDLFRSQKTSDAPPKKGGVVGKWGSVVGDKRAQAYDRAEGLHELAKLGTADAAEALLKRFSFLIDPSITDQEEKDVAFQGVLKAGRDAIEPVRAYAAKAESLAWPMRILKELVNEDEYLDELLVWLERWDTEYSKFIDPKLQILGELEGLRSPKIVPQVTRFLEDVNEPARFHAAVALLAQGDEAVAEPLYKLLAEEESTRVKGRLLEGLAKAGWPVPDALQDAVQAALPYGYRLDGNRLARTS